MKRVVVASTVCLIVFCALWSTVTPQKIAIDDTTGPKGMIAITKQ